MSYLWGIIDQEVEVLMRRCDYCEIKQFVCGFIFVSHFTLLLEVTSQSFFSAILCNLFLLAFLVVIAYEKKYHPMPLIPRILCNNLFQVTLTIQEALQT